jgi:hypothetical protein
MTIQQGMADMSMNNQGFSHWCCRGCGRLLGVAVGERLEIRSKQGGNFLVGFPVTTVCQNPRCNTINELFDSRQSSVPAQEAAAQL